MCADCREIEKEGEREEEEEECVKKSSDCMQRDRETVCVER